MPLAKDIFPFRAASKKAPAPRVDLISPYGFVDSKTHQAELQRSTQSPAISAQSRSSSQTAYYSYHGEEHDRVSRLDATSVMESTYSLVSTAECATARAEESEAEKSTRGGGKGFHLPKKFKLTLPSSPPKSKPQTPRSAAVSFGRGGAGNSFRALSPTSPTTPTAAKRHKSSNSDPTGVERLSMHTDHTESTADYTSDRDTYTPPRRQVGARASRWSLEPIRDQGMASRSSLESEWIENSSSEHRQHATPLDIPTSTRFGGMRASARSLSPEAVRPRWEEQRQEARNSSGTAVSGFGFSSATELGEFSRPRTSVDPRFMRSSGSLDLDQHGAPLSFAIPSHQLKNPPPSYDEATDHLASEYGQGDQRHLDEPRMYAHHAAYGAPLHQSPRPLPIIPRRSDRYTAPMEPVYSDHPRSKEGPCPFTYRPSMKKSAVPFSAASECLKERPNSRLSTAKYTDRPLHYPHSALAEPCHTCACHLEERHHPGSRVRVRDEHPDEHDTTPRQSLGRYQHRPVTPLVDRTPACTSQAELSPPPPTPTPTPDHVAEADTDEVATAPRTSAGSGSASVPTPSSPAAVPVREGSEETQAQAQAPPKQLSKMERALLRRQRA